MPNKPTLCIMITTMNERIQRVKKELLPQISHVDQIIISHQITNNKTLPEKNTLGSNVIYTYMKEQGLSKNRNNALSHATADICHICDDDIDFIPGFDTIIKEAYNAKDDLVTFQAIDLSGKKHFAVKEDGKHNAISVLRIWSRGITFKRQSIQEKSIVFDEEFGLGARYVVGEETIFLMESYRKGLSMRHVNTPITIHKKDSSGSNYRKELIIGRVAVFKKLYGLLGGVLCIIMYTKRHYPLYKNKYTPRQFIKIGLMGLWES